MKQVDSVFWIKNTLMSYNWARIMAVIGARRRGKTYAIKDLLLNFAKRSKAKFGSYKHKFVIFRDNDVQCRTICNDGGRQFWGDILTKKKWSSYDIKMVKPDDVPVGNIYINGEHAGYIMSILHYNKLKGSQYEDAKLGYWDEFIPEKVQKDQGDMALALINMLLTVASLRSDFKLIMSANALDKGNKVLKLFGFKINDFGIYKDRQKKVVLEYAPNSEAFEQYLKNGITYGLVKGTKYESNLHDNKFVDEADDSLFYIKRKPCDLYGIYHDENGDAVRIYESKDGNEFYASTDTNPNNAVYMRKAFKISVTGGNVRLGTNEEKNFLVEIYKNKLIKFEDKYILNLFKKIIK